MKTHRNRRFERRAATRIVAWIAVLSVAASCRADAQPETAQAAQPNLEPKTAAPAVVPAPAVVSSPAVVPAPAVVPSRLETLEARVSKASYAGGEPVYLDVTLSNRAAKPAAFLMLGPKLEFKLKRDGKIVGLTYRAKDQSKGDKISYRSVPIGGKIGYRVMLSRTFDLSRAGIYTLTCSKYLRNENRDPGADLVGPRLIAQDVKFTVTEADFEPLPAPQPVSQPAP